MITELMNHIQYLNREFEAQTDFNHQTWYKAKIVLCESLIKTIEKYYD
jgi:hypothetical protein